MLLASFSQVVAGSIVWNRGNLGWSVHLTQPLLSLDERFGNDAIRQRQEKCGYLNRIWGSARWFSRQRPLPVSLLVFSAHMVGRELALAGCPLTSLHAPRCKNPLINELWFDQMVLLDGTDFRTRTGTRHADVLLVCGGPQQQVRHLEVEHRCPGQIHLTTQ